MTTLGKLEPVNLDAAWLNEAQYFTPWLAQEDNLRILGDTIGLDLALEAQEKRVGPFRADILCKDTERDVWVLIENQLQRTDHGHLGQLLTYAAGLQAVTIVWIAKQFTEEHRATLDWLNEITDDRFRFFGLEIELWRIGDSPPAPKFNVISKPNDWTHEVGKAARGIENDQLSETKTLQFRYWGALRDLMIERRSTLRPQAPQPHHWATFGIGRAGFKLHAVVNTVDQRIGVELIVRSDEAKPHFFLLKDQQESIERELGLRLQWQELPDRKGSRIAIYKERTDPTNEPDWPSQHAWMVDTLERFDRVFRPRVRELDASEWGEAEDSSVPE